VAGTWTAPLACTSRTPACAAAAPGTLQLASAQAVVACKSVAVAVGSVGADMVAGGVWRDEHCGRSSTRPR